jgi:hypothetical protein
MRANINLPGALTTETKGQQVPTTEIDHSNVFQIAERVHRRDHQPTAQITQPRKQNFEFFLKGSENSENL